MRTRDRAIALPIHSPRYQTARARSEMPPSQLIRLVVILAALVGSISGTHAKGKPKTWSPPIPPGRAAITLSVRTVNAANTKVLAKVLWGRRLLGETPLNLQWPADSGPVDIVVQAPGHVPVHTRLYTFANEKVVVKLVDDEGKKKLFGYKRELTPAAATPAAPGVAAPGAAAPGTAAPSPPVATPAAATPAAATPPIVNPPAAPPIVNPPAAPQ